MRLAILGILLAVQVVLPTAAAGVSFGVLDPTHAVFDGAISFQEHALAAYQPMDRPGVRLAFSAHAAEVAVYVTNERVVGSTSLDKDTDPHPTTYPLHDLQGEVTGYADGWFVGMGLHGATTASTLDNLHVWPQGQGTLGNDAPSTEPDKPNTREFGWGTPSPALHARASGGFRVVGDVTLKVAGPTVRLDASENSTQISTATTRQIITVQERWVVLTLHGASVTLENAPNLDLLADALQIQYNGTLGSTGTAPTTGRWEVGIRPVQDAEGNARLAFDLRTQGHSPVVLTAGSKPVAIWLQGAFGALVATGATAFTVARLRRRVRIRLRLTAEECLEEARKAQRLRDRAGALMWARRAAKAGPRDAALLVEVAWHLDDAGRPFEAKVAYARAVRAARAKDGTAHAEYAIFLAKRFRDADRAEAMAVEALRRNPRLLSELFMEEAALRVLTGRPRFERAVQEAERFELAG